jgi:membrane-associated phospholipid phosphatase
MNKIMRRLWDTIVACYSPRNIGWQLLAVALTAVIVVTGFDWWWFEHTRDQLLQSWLFPAAIVGGLLPILVPAGFFLVKKFNTGFAVAQAALIGLAISSFYKIFTGRIPPPLHSSTFYTLFSGGVPSTLRQSLGDISRQFEFGFFRDGAFWGWPSSHTTIAFAVAVTLFILYRGNRAVQWGALLVALYIGIGVSTNIHWFSEFVAGAIIGSVIGAVVGKSFLITERYAPGAAPAAGAAVS